MWYSVVEQLGTNISSRLQSERIKQPSKQVGPKVTVTQSNFLLVLSSKESSHIGNREAYLEPVSYGVDVNRLTHSVLGACWSLPSGPHQIRAGIVIIIVITI